MAKTAANRTQPRTSGRARRPSHVDSRQLELSFVTGLEPAPLSPSAIRSPAPISGDLFDVPAVATPVRRKSAGSPSAAANDEVSAETLALLDIVDFMIDLWRKESGEDLRPVIFPNR